jgi:hypothetical protein
VLNQDIQDLQDCQEEYITEVKYSISKKVINISKSLVLFPFNPGDFHFAQSILTFKGTFKKSFVSYVDFVA